MRRELSVLSRSWLFAALLTLLTAVSCGACAKARAQSVPDGPPLDVPPPPARVLAPLEEPEIVVATPPDLPLTSPPPASPTPPPVRPAQRREPERTPESTPAAAASPVETPAEPKDLRPTSPALDAAAEKDVRDILARAARDLSRVDYGRLSADARAMYEQSKRFTEQAELALRDRNFLFALTLADKAATLAAGLAGR